MSCSDQFTHHYHSLHLAIHLFLNAWKQSPSKSMFCWLEYNWLIRLKTTNVTVTLLDRPWTTNTRIMLKHGIKLPYDTRGVPDLFFSDQIWYRIFWRQTRRIILESDNFGFQYFLDTDEPDGSDAFWTVCPNGQITLELAHCCHRVLSNSWRCYEKLHLNVITIQCFQESGISQILVDPDN